MNLITRNELDKCRQAMVEMFFKVAMTPENNQEIETFLAANDRHQAILSKEAREG